nr:glucosidase 2 beta-A-like protein 2 [Parasacculina yatsui]
MNILRLLSLAALICHECIASSVFGVAPSMASFYDISKPFTCLDGSKTILPTMLNDDYCDCEDGSDEPGTSACSYFNFYCANFGHVAMLIPSSRVNDGVCDCCDGSDERGVSNSPCADTCQELGAAVRERQQQLRQIQEEGLRARQEMAEKGQLKLKQTGDELQIVQQQLVDAERELQLRESTRDQAEQLEKELRQKYDATTSTEMPLEQTGADLADTTFRQLDVDGDDKLSLSELREDLRFDINHDQQVTLDDIKMMAPDSDEITRDVFVDNIWPSVSESFFDSSRVSEEVSDGVPAEDDTLWRNQFPPEDTTPPVQQSQHQQPDSDRTLSEEDGEYEEYDPHDSDEEDVGETDHETEEDEKEEAAPEPVYDPETQQAIDAAKLARDEYSSATNTVNKLRQRVDVLQKVLTIEFGTDSVYAALYRQCFVHNTHEYEYKLCLFDKATQKPISGGVETVLGQWGHWISGVESAQMYDNGQQCWNGPKRSTEVSIRCGVETRLLEVNEPSKCVYGIVMESPAACTETASEPSDHQSFHEEL